jgi:serine/threonine protein phosphatase 1
MKKPFRAVHYYRRNTTGRDFVVGDVHGCFSRLDEALAARRYDPTRDRLFSVGDLVDRGPESAQLLDAVRRHRIKAVRGNHEDMIVRWYFHDERIERLLSNGGGWFVDLEDGSGRARPFGRYMAGMPYAIQIDTAHGLVGLVHADAPHDHWTQLVSALENGDPDGPIRKQVLWQRARWSGQSTPEFAAVPASLEPLFGLPATGPASAPIDPHRPVRGVAAVVVGHTPVSAPLVRGNVIDIDTGAVYGGELTILDLAELPLLLARETA